VVVVETVPVVVVAEVEVVADESVAIVSVAIVSVDIVAPVSVAIVSVMAVSPVVIEVSVEAVSLTASSFLQPMASIETTQRATSVITRDFFICVFLLKFISEPYPGLNVWADVRLNFSLRGSKPGGTEGALRPRVIRYDKSGAANVKLNSRGR
jgi:hypothetical protein